jgi:multicomponent Na+:H+ antiporter subunit F
MSLNDYISFIILPILTISVVLVFIRFLRGPSVGDRVVALDLLITIGIAIIAVYSILTNHASFMDIALILALLSFLGTVAYSYYIDKKTRK